MFSIKKMRADHVIDFAAEELKKYLRMMMPECGEIMIQYEPNATDGFRLGLAEDFGLTFEDVKDPYLDDVVHIQTDEEDGILAGANSRSVLFAVYRFLKENGCRWLYPGIDGEYIPVQNIQPVTYHHCPSYRFRGQCNEGAESQQSMLETIDFYAKLEMNVYMLEFDIPFFYYDRYYSHLYNETNRTPEPITHIQVKQWKRQCETEIAKRGLQFHDIGHGWTAEPFGLSSKNQWVESDEKVPEEIQEHIALVNGKRELFKGLALNTQLCMSNPKTRSIMAKAVEEYVLSHQNVSYIHVWLGDGRLNHCECEECKKLRPSDYYIMLLNEIDERLTVLGLDTRVTFIVYYDTLFKPLQEKIKNKTRFSLLYAPLHRSYTSSVKRENIGMPAEYIRNAWEEPGSAEATAAYLVDWQKIWDGPCFTYEYHFFHQIYRDPGNMYISRRIYEDIISLDEIGLSGIVEDGTQRGFFPNGFAMYIYAAALLNKNCDYEKVTEDYFLHAYGEHWKEVKQYLDCISELFDFPYMEGEKSADCTKGKFYNPRQLDKLQQVADKTGKMRQLAERNKSLPIRVQTVSMRLLLRHTEYCEMLAELMSAIAVGDKEESRRLWKKMCDNFGRYEIEMERYYDHTLAMRALRAILIDLVSDIE